MSAEREGPMSRFAAGILTSMLLIAASSIALAEELPSLKGVDVYGTTKFDSAFVEEEFGTELVQLAEALAVHDSEGKQKIEKAIEERLERLGDFAFLALSSIRYFPPNAGLYITIDVVERNDMARRMPFREPVESVAYEDPGGLLAQWRAYEEAFRELLYAGKLESGDCEVLHCLAAFKPNPGLLPWLAVFNEGVAAHEDALYDVVTKGANPQNRGTSIFLLAHTEDIDRLMPVLGRAIYDSSSKVRNNAMRVMLMIADENPDLPFPVADLIAAMDFPATTDRNKATYAVAYLARSSRHREIVLENAVPIALRLLRLQQPNNHDAAYFLLKNISGEDFGERDYDAWEQWFKTAAGPPSRDRSPPPRKSTPGA